MRSRGYREELDPRKGKERASFKTRKMIFMCTYISPRLPFLLQVNFLQNLLSQCPSLWHGDPLGSLPFSLAHTLLTLAVIHFPVKQSLFFQHLSINLSLGRQWKGGLIPAHRLDEHSSPYPHFLPLGYALIVAEAESANRLSRTFFMRLVYTGPK